MGSILPIHLKSEVSLAARAVGVIMALFLAFMAWIFWQMSGARIDGLSLSFSQAFSTFLGYPMATFKPGDANLRIECVGFALMFVGFALWFLCLAFRSAAYWTVTDDHIERRTGDKRDIWPIASLATTQLLPFNSSAKSVWAVGLKLKSGKRLRLSWVKTRTEAEMIMEAITARIAAHSLTGNHLDDLDHQT